MELRASGTVVLGKRVDFDHNAVPTGVTSKICILSNLTWYPIISMDGLFTSCMWVRQAKIYDFVRLDYVSQV